MHWFKLSLAPGGYWLVKKPPQNPATKPAIKPNGGKRPAVAMEADKPIFTPFNADDAAFVELLELQAVSHESIPAFFAKSHWQIKYAADVSPVEILAIE